MEVIQRAFELATFIAGIAVLTLLIGRPQATAQVIGAATGGFDDLLQTITLQKRGSGTYG
jgi:hypothetical protein